MRRAETDEREREAARRKAELKRILKREDGVF